jgi:hypothetical protein
MCNLISLITLNIYLSLNSKKGKVGVRRRKNMLRMWMAMEMEVEREMGARTEKSARREMGGYCCSTYVQVLMIISLNILYELAN